VDDKGCVLIACWGMPNMSYLDNAHRALEAAAKIRPELERLGMQTSIGVTSADVYCGTVGSLERMEYAAIGSEVNMAARLMGKAKGRLLVGQGAYANLPSSDQARVEEIEPLLVKGKVEPLQAYSYVASALEMVNVKAGGKAGIDIPPGCKAALWSLLESIAAAPNSLSSSKSNSGLALGSGERYVSARLLFPVHWLWWELSRRERVPPREGHCSEGKIRNRQELRGHLAARARCRALHPGNQHTLDEDGRPPKALHVLEESFLPVQCQQ
jgi:hypothetical protein